MTSENESKASSEVSTAETEAAKYHWTDDKELKKINKQPYKC